MAKNMELNIVMGAAVGGALANLAKVQNGLKGVEKQSKILGETTKKLAEENRKLSDTQKSLKAFDNARRTLNNTNLEYMKAVKNLNILRKSYREAGESKAEFAKRVKEAEKQVEKLNRQKEAQKHVFERARSAIEAEGHSLKTYSDDLIKVEKQLKRNAEAKEKLDKTQERYSRMSEMAGNVANNSAKVLGGMVIPFKVYIDVEESQADLRKILGKEAELYYDKLAEISKKSPLSQIDLNEIAGALSQGGIKGNEIVEYTNKAQQMKVAFDISTKEAGEFLAKTREQLNLVGEEGTKNLFAYMDTINKLSNKYPVQAAELADISLRTAGYAKNIGLAKEANLGFATALQSTLKSSEQTSTVLSKLYSELAQGANTKAKASALQFLGIKPGTIEKEMAKDAEGTILKVLEKIKNANLADKAGLIGNIFGNNASTQNGIAVLTENLEGLKTKLNEAKQAAKENETVNAEYEERIATMANELKMAKNKVMLGLADLGAALAPLAKSFLEAVTPMITGLADFIKKNPKLTAGIMSTIAVVAGLGVAGGKAFQIYAKFQRVRSFFTFLRETGRIGRFFGIITGIGGKVIGIFKMIGLALKAAFMANPVVLIIVAIVAVIAILVVLYKKNKTFRDFVNKMWKEISQWAVAVWNSIKVDAINVFNFLKSFISIWINAVIANFKLIWVVVSGVFKIIGNNIKTVMAVCKGIFKLFVAFVSGKWNEIPGIALGIWESVKSGISGFVEAAKGILKGLFDWFGSQWENIKKGASELGNSINPLKWGKNYTGTNYWTGGLTTVAERGAELIKIPGQSPFLAQSEMMLNLPKGTQILNNSQTRNSLKDKVSNLRDRVSNFSKSTNSIAGDNITIQIIAGDKNKMEIAREVERILRERENRKRRVDYNG